MVGEPHKPDQVDHEERPCLLEWLNISILECVDPELVSWRIDVADGVLPHEQEVAHELTEVHVCLADVVVGSEENEDEGEG